MGLFSSNEENVRKILSKSGLEELSSLNDNESKAIERIVGILEFGKSQSSLMGENAKLIAQSTILESVALIGLLNFQKLNELNKNIEKLIAK